MDHKSIRIELDQYLTGMIVALSAVVLNSFDYLLLLVNELKAFIYDKDVETRKN